jgi:hypothetical protein
MYDNHTFSVFKDFGDAAAYCARPEFTAGSSPCIAGDGYGNKVQRDYTNESREQFAVRCAEFFRNACLTEHPEWASP